MQVKSTTPADGGDNRRSRLFEFIFRGGGMRSEAEASLGFGGFFKSPNKRDFSVSSGARLRKIGINCAVLLFMLCLLILSGIAARIFS